jgi:pumilio family protein 6
MLVDPVISSANALYIHPQGRRSPLHLLVPRSRWHFTLAQIACLEVTDAIRERTSKQSFHARETEVRIAASAELLGWVEREGRTIV